VRSTRSVALAAGVLVAVLAAGLAGELGAAAARTAGLPAADPLDDRKHAVDDQIAQLRDTLEGASADVVKAAVAVETAQSGLARAQAASAAASAAVAAAVTRDQQVSAALALALAEQAKAERELASGQAEQAGTRRELGAMVRETYMGSGLTGLSLALGADTPEQFSERVTLAGVALRSQGGVLDVLAVQQAELRARGAKVHAVAAEVAELKSQSIAAVAARRAARQAAVRAQAAIAASVAAELRALGVARSKVAAERSRMASLQGEQSKLRAMLAARARAAAAAAAAAERRRRQQGGGGGAGGGASGGGGGGGRASSGFLSYPANGPITSGFGMRYHPILHIWRLHSGTDFGIACGTPVYAAAAGTVISAGWAGGYGNRVVIDHGIVNGVDLATTYNHLTRIVVGGGSVSRGELIAYSGTTGLSTGCHLHFETLVNGNFVDPMRWL
jgi:murein DD-endopeptidase MepM/ murein hydrolase activator NlpD